MTTAKNEFFSNINIWLVREGGGGAPWGASVLMGVMGGVLKKSIG